MVDPVILREAAEAAVKVERLTRCPAELIMAQWALESNFGINALGHNSLGFKAYKGGFGRQLERCFEDFTDAEAAAFLQLGDGRTLKLSVLSYGEGGKRRYECRDWFAVFESTEACFMHRAARFEAGAHLPFIVTYFRDRDLAALFLGVAKSGYDTASPEKYVAALTDRSRRPEIVAALAAARSGHAEA